MSKKSSMNILMLTLDFPPEVGSASDLFHELAKTLVQRGHRITVITTFPRSYSYRVTEKEVLDKTRGKLFQTEYMDDIRVIRLKGLPLPSGSIFWRGMEHFLLPFILTFGGLFSGVHDVMLVYSPPLPLAFDAYFLGKIKGVPLVVNIQDLFPQEVVDHGVLKNRFVIKVLESMERFVYKKTNHLTVNSDS